MKNKNAVKGPPRGKRPNILKECYENLDRAFEQGKGRSKHEDKKDNGGKVPIEYIYMDATLRVYKRALRCFIRFARLHRVRFHNRWQMYNLLNQFVTYLILSGYSAWTIKTYVCGICKALGFSSFCIAMPKRRRADIRRSRGHGNEEYLRHTAERHRKLVLFCVCVGARKNKELRYVQGSDLRQRNGIYYIRIAKGKGGQARMARIIGSQNEIRAIVKMCLEAGDDLLFPSIPSHIDVHALRAIYACRVYLAHARPLDSLLRKEKHYFKNDMIGYVADKRAMRIASENLGHHRINVIAGHYLWALQEVSKIGFSFLAAA